MNLSSRNTIQQNVHGEWLDNCVANIERDQYMIATSVDISCLCIWKNRKDLAEAGRNVWNFQDNQTFTMEHRRDPRSPKTSNPPATINTPVATML